MSGTYKTYKARGIVLHALKYSDTSLIVHLLTDTRGRQSYMVQGIRHKKGSKLALFQPMFALEFEGLDSSRGQMHRFREVQNGLVLQRIPFDVHRSTIALFMAEVLYRLVKESEPDERLFDFVWESIGALDEMEEGVANFHLWFLVNLSRLLGFFPGNPYRQGDWFDVREGLYSATNPSHESALDPERARLLNDFIECDVRCLAEIGLNRGQRSSFLEALLVYYGYHLDAIHAVRSLNILKEVF